MTDQVTDPLAGLSDHDKAMIAKVDEVHAKASGQPAPAPAPAAAPAPAPAPAKAERPADVPEKFWDAAKGEVRWAEILKSNQELERKLSQPKPAAEPAKPAEGDNGGQPQGNQQATPESEAKAAEEAAKAAGADVSKVDFVALSTEFAEKGELSAEAYQKLEAAGMSRDLVDQFIEGRRAVMQTQVNEAFTLAGGEDQYGKMLDWALKNLPADEQSAFDRAVVADPATRKQAITALSAQYKAAMGSDPSLVRGNGGGAADAVAFQSRAEVTEAMRDPRYNRDPAYRALVERRIAAMPTF